MPDNKARMHVLTSMMKNPKISKMISDAWDAPVGSTKRKQIKSVIDSVNKLSEKKFNDGKGGTGTTFKKMDYLPYTPNTTNSYDRLMVMPAAPSMINDGKGGPANQSMASYSSPLQSKEIRSTGTPTWSPGSYDIEGKPVERQQISGPSQIGYFYPKSIVKKPGTDIMYGVPQPTDYVDYKPWSKEKWDEESSLAGAAHWIGGQAIPSIGNTLTKAGLGVSAAGEMAVDNTAKLINNLISKHLLGSKRLTPVPYTGWGDTEGGRRLDVATRTTSLPKGQPGGAVQQVATPQATPKMSVGDPRETLKALGVQADGQAGVYGPAVPSDFKNLVSTVSGAEKKIGPEQENADKYYTALVDTGFTPTEASQKVQSEMGLTPTVPGVSSSTTTTPGGAALLQEIAGGHVSPTAFISDIMSRDLPTLRSMFPGVPDDQLPHGASLSGQIADLQKTLKLETGLDKWLNERQQLIDRGETLTTDLTDYIRGRDEYIKGVDTMIDNTKNTLLNTDVSDPRVEKRMGDYMNYLYVLKGRQNKRYVDFLNDSVNQHNAQLKEVDNMYTQAKDLYTNELATKTAITQEEYNRWSTMLSDTWNAIHQQNDPTAQLDYQYKVAQINKMNAETAKMAGETLNDVSGTKYWVQQKDYANQFVDDKGNLIDINLAPQMKAAAEQGYDPQGIVSLVERGIATKIKSSSDFDSAYSGMKDINNNLYGVSKEIDPTLAYNLAAGMYDKSKEIIRKYVKDNSGKFINAIKDLTPSKGLDFEFDWMKPKGADWIDKYSKQGLNKDFLTDIYNAYTKTADALGESNPDRLRGIFTGPDASGEGYVQNIDESNIDTIADSIVFGVTKMGLERIPQPAQ